MEPKVNTSVQNTLNKYHHYIETQFKVYVKSF